MDEDLDPDVEGILDGKDVEDYENTAAARVKAEVYGQKFRSSGLVGDLAENVSDVAGVAEGEMARAIRKLLEKVKRSIEARACGDYETAKQSGTNPYQMRGLGNWISDSAQSVLPVDENYLTPSASINTTASTAAVTENAINNVLQSIYEQTGARNDFDGFCGVAMKRALSDLQLYDANVSAGTAYTAVRQINKSMEDVKLTKRIDIIEGDFGTVRLHTSLLLAYNGTAAEKAGRLYICDMSDLEMGFVRTPSFRELPDMGGGRRGIVEAIGALKVGNPKKHGAFKPTAA